MTFSAMKKDQLPTAHLRGVESCCILLTDLAVAGLMVFGLVWIGLFIKSLINFLCEFFMEKLV